MSKEPFDQCKGYMLKVLHGMPINNLYFKSVGSQLSL